MCQRGALGIKHMPSRNTQVMGWHLQTWPESSHLPSLWQLCATFLAAQRQPLFVRLPLALFSRYDVRSRSKSFGKEGQVRWRWVAHKGVLQRLEHHCSLLPHGGWVLLFVVLAVDLYSVISRTWTPERPWKLKVGGSQTRLVPTCLQGDGHVLTLVALLPCTGRNVHSSVFECCIPGEWHLFPDPQCWSAL